jgi:hypothetical protein
VYGVASAREFEAIVDSANAAAHFTLNAVGDGFGPSDQSSFYIKNIPVLHFFTDLHADYHRATDDADKINAAGEARVIAFAADIVKSIGDRPKRPTFIRTPGPPPVLSSSAGTATYFGSVPDMGATDVVGVRLAGVTPGSPADKAGVLGGDVIVEFGGRTVRDLYEYTDAIRAHKPGDVVEVVVDRSGQRLKLTATLGKRGG